MIRVVLAVLLSAAILGVVLPAADTARSQRAATLAADEANEFTVAVDRFVRRNDPVPVGSPGATRLVTVRMPAATTLRIRDGHVAWTHGDRTHRVTTDTQLAGNLTVGPGTHQVRLSLHRENGEPVVTVRRFKPENAASHSRVRNPLGAPDVPL